MAKTKTVVLFVRHVNEEENVDKIFTEATEVGKGMHYETGSDFINDLAAAYRRCTGNDKFRIVNVVIG